MALTWLSPKAEARDAGPKGMGVYAVDRIDAGETIIAYGGHIATGAELRATYAEYQTYALQIDDDLFVVCESEPDPADYLNHSCEPNAGIVGNVLVKAMRNIEPGEEICYDYAMSDHAPYDEFSCECGTASCRHQIRSTDWTRPELQAKYAGFFSAYLQRKINAL